jgi:hypothetical protein
MTDADMIRTIDEVEARLRGLEHKLYRVRAALRQRIDPYKRRKDLGYWEEDQPAWDVSAHVNEPEVGR